MNTPQTPGPWQFEPTDGMKEYLYVAVFGLKEHKQWVAAESQKEAGKKFWDGLGRDMQNVTESIEYIEVRDAKPHNS